MSQLTQDEASAVLDRSRAEGRGSGRLPGSRRTRAAVGVIAAGVVAAVMAIVFSCGSGAKPAPRYGGLPSWLPKATAATDHLVTATAARPKLAVEGDTVRVELTQGQADITVVGPQVSEEGKFPVPPTTPCSFTITLTRVSGEIALRGRDFTILAENRHLYHPRVSGAHGRTVPSVVKSGETVVLTLKAVLPTGGGQVRWRPESGPPIGSWDFDVEID